MKLTEIMNRERNKSLREKICVWIKYINGMVT